MEYQQRLRMEQRLLQSPQMIQAMQVLQLTTSELLDRVEAELEDNPFLESASEEASEDGAEASEAEGDEDFPELEELDRLLESDGSLPRSSAAADSDWDVMQNLPASQSHTRDSIISELRADGSNRLELGIAELLLAGMDARGFLPNGVEQLAIGHDIAVNSVSKTLDHLRELTHPALGARDIKDCYLLQLSAMPEPHPTAEILVGEHFDELLANKLPQIATAMKVSLAEVRLALEILAVLDSRPLQELENDDSVAIIPDILIECDHQGVYQVSLVRDRIPEVRLSKAAQIALSKTKGDKRLHEFLLKKIERARWFIDAIGQRCETLLRISKCLVERQRDFLDFGPERQQPLKMQEVADELGIHISTVSRAVRGQWAQTPQGVLRLKSFFSGGQRTSSGGSASRASIQERVREIISAEDANSPYSDEEIVRILRERNGVRIARRTVTKYRKAFNIPASTMRRNFS